MGVRDGPDISLLSCVLVENFLGTVAHVPWLLQVNQSSNRVHCNFLGQKDTELQGGTSIAERCMAFCSLFSTREMSNKNVALAL